jgi:endonuclease-3
MIEYSDKMDKKTANIIIDRLKSHYGTPTTALNYNNEFELLVSVILSAQCTDERVNKITPALFERFGTAEKMAKADIEEIKKLIFSCGFYNNKALSLKSASEELITRFNGVVPSTREELMSLRGVGRKTANVVYAVAFGGQAMPVDTHVFRVSHRLGFSNSKTPDKTEADIVNLLDNKQLTQSHHLLITHGRKTCHARRPQCEICCVKELCVFYEQNIIKA